MKDKINPISPTWHAEVAAELNREFTEHDVAEMSARHRRAYLGLKFHHVKARGKADGSIPHGGFADWMRQHCPAIPDRTMRRYMTEARSICTCLGWQIGQIGRFEIPPHRWLELPPEQLPAAEQKMQARLLDLIQGGGPQANAEEETSNSGGSGSGAGEAEQFIALEASAARFIRWVREHLHRDGFPRMTEVPGGKETWDTLRAVFRDANRFCETFEKPTEASPPLN